MDMVNKICLSCNLSKLQSEFNGRLLKCKECQSQDDKNRYLNDPEIFRTRAKEHYRNREDKAIVIGRSRQQRLSNPERHNDSKRKSLYGITREQYDKMKVQQDFKCAICLRSESESSIKLCIDHNHNTNKIRGLLCHDCNKGIGFLKDNQTILQNAINYLAIYQEALSI
jgi:hypothetical protein